MPNLISSVSKLLKFILLISLVVHLGTAFWMQLPEQSEILAELQEDPIQTESIREPFELEKSNVKWKITPLYDYSARGLVVSDKRYDAFALYDTSHFYPMDLCLVWGANVENEVYRKATFWQDHRWCLWQYPYGASVNGGQVSNNHLVPASDKIYKELKKVRKGDQVLIEGALISAEGQALAGAKERTPGEMRFVSSTSREDSGGGACEYIYVEKFEILKRGQPMVAVVYDVSKMTLWGSVVLIMVLFAVEVFRPVRSKFDRRRRRGRNFPG